ncbi:hypothetical protein LR48_Vigan97s000800 [Vigna angularis]|uniref:Uncharacterized protein n=1 Tax=Phaseolus angularis TaxID=3914 RepID=A0A0L9T403_PHAAN|nr:hypothetical protein LR48_Vigan97s000800 [Vigna angularis]
MQQTSRSHIQKQPRSWQEAEAAALGCSPASFKLQPPLPVSQSSSFMVFQQPPRPRRRDKLDVVEVAASLDAL